MNKFVIGLGIGGIVTGSITTAMVVVGMCRKRQKEMVDIERRFSDLVHENCDRYAETRMNKDAILNIKAKMNDVGIDIL